MNDVESRIIDLIANFKKIPASQITMETPLSTLEIDSLDKINLSFEVEEMFGIEIPDASLNSLKTVGDIIRGVESLRDTKPGAVAG